MKRDMIILGAAILFGIAALMFYELQMSSIEQEMKAQFQDKVAVCYLAKGVGSEQELIEALLEKRDIPKKFLHPQSIYWKDRAKIIGQRLRLPLQAKQPVLWSDLAETSRRTVSDTILPGRGVVSVPIDNIGGVSGLIAPGSRVDLYGVLPQTSVNALRNDARQKLKTMESTVSGTPGLGDLAKSLEKIEGIAAGGRLMGDAKSEMRFQIVPIARNLGVFAVDSRTQMSDVGGASKYSTLSFDVDHEMQLVLMMAVTAVGKGDGRLICILRSNEGGGEEDERPFQTYSSENLLDLISQSLSTSK